MIDLKSPLDAVNAADAALKQKAAEINDLFAQGTPEAVKQALDMQSALDELQSDYDNKLALYQKLVKANAPSNVAKLFVHAAEANEDEIKNKTMNRSAFDALDHAARSAFISAGGKVED